MRVLKPHRWSRMRGSLLSGPFTRHRPGGRAASPPILFGLHCPEWEHTTLVPPDGSGFRILHQHSRTRTCGGHTRAFLLGPAKGGVHRFGLRAPGFPNGSVSDTSSTFLPKLDAF